MTADRVAWAEQATLDEAIAYSREILDRVIDETKQWFALNAVCGLFSGGNDSTTFMHLFRNRFDYAVHINTGIGIQETREYVRRCCADWNLPLLEELPPAGCSYRELVLKYGFPGPAGHMLMYTRLKERALRAVRRRLITNGRRQRVIYVAGMRYFESDRRSRNTEEVNRQGSIVWCSPLMWWTSRHMAEYRERFDVPRNEVSDNLHMSGECLCGAFAKPGELETIRFFYPETAAIIEALQDEVAAAGQHATWGTRPPRRAVAGQGAFDLEATGEVGLLCAKCEHFAEVAP
jgi:3'-phosphoadenosine 5'-phosphosulfate sulfotransferase (PAPS reductase)/FAD synthetase